MPDSDALAPRLAARDAAVAAGLALAAAAVALASAAAATRSAAATARNTLREALLQRVLRLHSLRRDLLFGRRQLRRRRTGC